MKKILTDRQRDILSFIEQFRNENGFPPTLREIGKKFGISSTFGVKRHLDALVKKGYISVESNASRGISFAQEFKPPDQHYSNIIYARNEHFVNIPIVGRVAAGSPILSEENIEGTLLVDKAFLKNSSDCFALKVRGNSMINAGIFENDFVVVSPQHFAINGQIIVARIDDEITVKKYYKKNNTITLLPENDQYEPIIVSENRDFSIVGKVLGLIRWYN